MPTLEAAHIYGVQIRESANDGSDFSNGDTDYRILFVGEDGLFHLKDSAGTVTTPTGMADPMSARGDIIVRNASNVTARLAIGSAGKVLSSDGTDVSWQTPTGGCSGFSLSPSSDTHIDSQSATTNFDSNTTMTLGNKWGTSSFSRFGLMTFDTSALAGKTIYRAVLRLVRTDTSALTAATTYLQARRVLRAYNPTQVTWNVYSTGNNWTTAGAQSAGNDVSTEVHGIQPLITAPGLATAYMLMDITSLLQADLDASSSTFRFILGMSNADGSINTITLASLDHGTAAYRPKLLVVAS